MFGSNRGLPKPPKLPNIPTSSSGIGKIAITAALNYLSKHPEIVNSAIDGIQGLNIAMPNIPTKTTGGERMWITLCESNGWKLQQNTFTHHARILNNDNYRIAWGSLSGMKKYLNTILEFSKYSNH